MYLVIFCVALAVAGYIVYEKVTAVRMHNTQCNEPTSRVEVEESVGQSNFDHCKLGCSETSRDTVDETAAGTAAEEHLPTDVETIVEQKNTGFTGRMYGHLSNLTNSTRRGMGYVKNRFTNTYRLFGQEEDTRDQDDAVETDAEPSSERLRKILNSVEEEDNRREQTDGNVSDSSAHQSDSCQEENEERYFMIRRGSDGRHRTILKTEDDQMPQQEDDVSSDQNNDTLTDQTGFLNPSMNDGTHENVMSRHKKRHDKSPSRKSGVLRESEQQSDETLEAPIAPEEKEDETVNASPKLFKKNRQELRNRRLTTTVNPSDIPS